MAKVQKGLTEICSLRPRDTTGTIVSGQFHRLKQQHSNSVVGKMLYLQREGATLSADEGHGHREEQDIGKNDANYHNKIIKVQSVERHNIELNSVCHPVEGSLVCFWRM